MQILYILVKRIDRSRLKLQWTSRDMVRLLQILVDLSDLKIINNRVIDLADINTVVDGNPN